MHGTMEDGFARTTPFQGSMIMHKMQWSERSPFTSEVAGSILSDNILSVA